jgi:hypothetical protein
MTQNDRDLGRRWFEDVWNKGRRDAIPEMLAPESVLHEGGSIPWVRTGSTHSLTA